MPDDEFHDPFQIVDDEKWAHYEANLRGIEVKGLLNLPDPAGVLQVGIPFPWEQEKSLPHIDGGP
jgi:hypothetical protein